MDSFNLQPPFMGPELPIYPTVLQTLRVTDGIVTPPVGSTSLIYLSVVEQLRSDTLIVRDRESCLAVSPTGGPLTEGYYLGRLSGQYNGLPVYVVIDSGGSSGGCGYFLGNITAMTQASLPGVTIGADSCTPIGQEKMPAAGWFLYTFKEQMVACNGGASDLSGGRSSSLLMETNNLDVHSLLPFYARIVCRAVINGNQIYEFTAPWTVNMSWPPVGPIFGPPWFIPITIISGYNPITGQPTYTNIWGFNPACNNGICPPPYEPLTYITDINETTCAVTTATTCVLYPPCCPPWSKPIQALTAFDPTTCIVGFTDICGFLQ